jgi:hypothetical protein
VTFKQATYEVLRRAGRPLDKWEIWREIRRLRLKSSSGGTPEDSLAAQVYLDIQENGSASLFQLCGPGMFGTHSGNDPHSADRDDSLRPEPQSRFPRWVEGPYPTKDRGKIVRRWKPGVYVFSRSADKADYVGRADNDLSQRIMSSCRGYQTFWFAYASSPRDAYLRECALWHGLSPTDNRNHPGVPAGSFWRCPVSGCEWN